MTIPLLPCLKDFDWPGKDGCVARPLWAEGKSRYVPWVAFGYDLPHSFEFLPQAELARLGKTEAEVERVAIQELRQRRASWQPWNIKLGLFKKLKMLACGNDFFAAERILDPIFLQDAQRQLQAKGLLLGVPRRGALVATDAFQDDARLNAFLALVYQQFIEGGSPPISPVAFAAKDGRIISIVDDAVRMAKPPQTTQAESNHEGTDVETYVSRILTDVDGKVMPVILAVDTDFDRLANALVQAVARTTVEFLSRDDFIGEIRVAIPSNTPNLAEGLPRLRAHLERLAFDLAARSGRTVRISIDATRSANF